MKRKKTIKDDAIKALKKANREIAFDRNGGGQFVSYDRPWKNHKKYDRKRDRKVDLNGLFCVYPLFPKYKHNYKQCA